MEIFKDVPKTLVRMYIAFLIGAILMGMLFVVQCIKGLSFINPVYTFLIFLSCILLLRVAYAAILEYKNKVGKR